MPADLEPVTASRAGDWRGEWSRSTARAPSAPAPREASAAAVEVPGVRQGDLAPPQSCCADMCRPHDGNDSPPAPGCSGV